MDYTSHLAAYLAPTDLRRRRTRRNTVPLRAVLFDMDGTLTDSGRIWTTAYRQMAAELGGELTDAGRAKLVGQSLGTSVALLHRELGVDADAAGTAVRLLEIVSDLYQDHLIWRPGARELLSGVRRDGLQTALVTSSPRELVDQALSTLGAGTFNTTVSVDDVAFAKPHPDPYLTAMEHLGMGPKECVAIEDSASGALSAGRAGVPVLVVASSKAGAAAGTLAMSSLEFASPALLRAIHQGFALSSPRA